MEHSVKGGLKIYTNSHGQLNKRAAMPIYGKNTTNLFFFSYAVSCSFFCWKAETFNLLNIKKGRQHFEIVFKIFMQNNITFHLKCKGDSWN